MPVTIIARPSSAKFSKENAMYQLSPSVVSASKKVQIKVIALPINLNDVAFNYPSTGWDLNIVEFNVSGIVDPFITCTRPMIDGSNYKVPQRAFNSNECWISTRLFDPSLTTQEPFVEDGTNRVLLFKGGYSIWPNDPNFDWENERKWFWSWQNSGKTIAPNEWHWLLFVNPVEASLNLLYILTYTDGSTFTQTKPLDFINSLPTKKWVHGYIPVGVEQADLQMLQPTKKIVKFSVKVQRMDTAEVLASYDLNVDYRPHYDAFIVYYRNSLGGWDSLRILGEWNEVFNYTRKEFAGRDDDGNGNLRFYDSRERRKWQVNTGHISKQDIDALRDMMLSRELAIISEKKWLPVRVSAEDLSGKDTRNPLPNVALEFESGYENESYTPDVLPWT